MIMMRKDNHINSNNNVDGSNNHNIAVGSVPSYNAFSMKSIWVFQQHIMLLLCNWKDSKKG